MIVTNPRRGGRSAIAQAVYSAITPTFPRRLRDCGFTLLEVLVVLLIMGLFVGLVSAITRPDDRALLQLEARRLAALLDLAAAKPRLTGKAVAWTANGPDYKFWQFNEESGWSEMHAGDELRARTLPQGMKISDLLVETVRPQNGMRLEFIAYGPTLAYAIELSLGAERYTVAASPAGDVRVLAGTDATYVNATRP